MGGTKLFHDYFQVGSACYKIRFFWGVLNIKLNRALLELKRVVELRSFISGDGILRQELFVPRTMKSVNSDLKTLKRRRKMKNLIQSNEVPR